MQSEILLKEKYIKQLVLGSSVCAEVASVIEGTDFHFKSDAGLRSLSINFNEFWIKHLGGKKVMLKRNVFFEERSLSYGRKF